MRSVVTNYMGMLAIAVVAVLVIGAIAVRIDHEQEVEAPAGIAATPAISGNAPEGLVDARWLMQYGTQIDHIFDLSDLQQYEAGHIPGAIHIWWQDAMSINAPHYGEPDRITVQPDTSLFGRLNLHVLQNARIVLYDSNDSERATWLLWVMTINGFTDVHVLDGGLPAWIGAGGELSTDVADTRDTDLIATPTWNEDVQIRREPLRDSLDDPNLKVVDTRSEDEYGDTVNETVREGHIPGSINIPTATVMREDGTFKSPEELRSLFEAHGISPDNQVVVYSLFPVQSGNVWLAFQIAGYGDVSIYMEGYSAWGRYDDLPVSTEPYAAPETVATPVPAATAPPTPEMAATPATSPEDEGPTDLTGD